MREIIKRIFIGMLFTLFVSIIVAICLVVAYLGINNFKVAISVLSIPFLLLTFFVIGSNVIDS